MADVFISYKREDRAWAERVEALVTGAGFTTWWDTSLVAGEHFNEAIDRELNAARCVVVVWSEASKRSRWVQAEAVYGFDKGILVAGRVDDVKLGYPFSVVQTLDLRRDLSSIMGGVRIKLGAPAETPKQPPPPPPAPPPPQLAAQFFGKAASAFKDVRTELLKFFPAHSPLKKSAEAQKQSAAAREAARVAAWAETGWRPVWIGALACAAFAALAAMMDMEIGVFYGAYDMRFAPVVCAVVCAFGAAVLGARAFGAPVQFWIAAILATIATSLVVRAFDGLTPFADDAVRVALAALAFGAWGGAGGFAGDGPNAPYSPLTETHP
ncbi:MAG: toll/interleukin-1 receptor domain-containing protein [Hyphomonadaceae bacterium]